MNLNILFNYQFEHILFLPLKTVKPIAWVSESVGDRLSLGLLVSFSWGTRFCEDVLITICSPTSYNVFSFHSSWFAFRQRHRKHEIIGWGCWITKELLIMGLWKSMVTRLVEFRVSLIMLGIGIAKGNMQRDMCLFKRGNLNGWRGYNHF